MASAIAAGTFSTASTFAPGKTSDVMTVPTGKTTMRLTITGADASNTVKTQKRTTPGGAFVDQTTYNSDQAAVAVTVADREEWRLMQVTAQTIRDLKFKLDCS